MNVKKPVLIIGIVVAVAIIAVLAIFAFKNNGNTGKTDETTTVSSTSSTTSGTSETATSEGTTSVSSTTAGVTEAGWSEWVTTLPGGVTNTNYIIEPKTQYQYREKEFTTSPTDPLAGWTKYDTTSVWSEFGDWSEWSTTMLLPMRGRKVETRTVVDPAYIQYNLFYYRYRLNPLSDWIYTWKNVAGSTKYIVSVPSKSVAAGAMIDLYQTYKFRRGFEYFKDEVWFKKSEDSIPASSHTEYRHADRSLIYTYHFYRWKDWSPWQDGAVLVTADREVNTQVIYRYKLK